jgi:hypothetical protein
MILMICISAAPKHDTIPSVLLEAAELTDKHDTEYAEAVFI